MSPVAEGTAVPERPISHHFPAHVRDALVAAAHTPITHDHLARAKAIDRAAERARLFFPQLFRPERTTP